MNTIPLRPFFTAKLLVLAATVVLLLSSCEYGIRGSGRVTTENRPVDDFTTLEARGAMEIEWTPGGPALAVTTDENLQQYVEATVRGHKLVLQTREVLRPTRKLHVRVTSPALTAVALRGAVRLDASRLSGQSFYLDGEGATVVTLQGTVATLTASMAGASRLNAASLQTQTTELSISGAGRADVFASERLRAAISGAGKVSYAGNPKSVEKRISGAGSIHRSDESDRVSLGHLRVP